MSTAKPIRRLPLRVALKRSMLACIAAFALLMAVLSVRMAAGDDPALGPKLDARKHGASAEPKAPAPSVATVLTIPSGEEESEDGAGIVTVPVAPAPSAPTTQPAPAPAPVQTTTS